MLCDMLQVIQVRLLWLSNTLICRCRYLDWVSAADGLPRDGRWSCGTHDYPSMHHSLMHPCSSDDNNCCGNARTAPFLLRYESFFHSQNALLVLAYEVRGLPHVLLAHPDVTAVASLWRGHS